LQHIPQQDANELIYGALFSDGTQGESAAFVLGETK